MHRTGRALALVLIAAGLPAAAAEIYWAPPIAEVVGIPYPVHGIGEVGPAAAAPFFPDAWHLRLEGPIVPGDGDRLAALLAEKLATRTDLFNNTVVSLNSDGGDFYEGLKIADAISRNAVSTYVGRGDRCLSSCAIAFLGGQNVELRGRPPAPSRFLHAEGTLGFHSPFSDLPAAMQIPDGMPFSQALGGQMANQFYGQAQAAINEVAKRMSGWNLSPDFVFRMLGKGTFPGDTRDVGERFVLVDSFRALSETRTTLVAPSVAAPREIGLVDAANACNLITVMNMDEFAVIFGYGFGYRAYVNQDVIAEGVFADRDSQGNPTFTPILTAEAPAPRIVEAKLAVTSYQYLVPATGRDSFFFQAAYPGRGPAQCNVYRGEAGGWLVQTFSGNTHSGALFGPGDSAVDGANVIIDFAAPVPLNSYLLLGIDDAWNSAAPLVPSPEEAEILARYPDIGAPSFDCSGQLDRAAEMICGVRLLAQLDGLMGRLYTEALATKGQAVREEQRFWLATRERLCRAETIDPNDTIVLRNLIECLHLLYSGRVKDLAGLPPFGMVSP